jgi:predicted transcriptional regulator
MVRLDETLMLAIEELAEERFTSSTSVVRSAVVEYLIRHNKMPPPRKP